jgi:EAL domain-containing protein (putative c-di-GMP-specific phosphodiesterase class I)
MAPPFLVADHEVFVSVSIGAAVGRGGRDRPEDVLQNADVAVQRAKDAGGAHCEVFRQEMNPHPLERLGLEAELRHAVERDEFFLEYQPEVDLATGRIVGAEALLRWRHPDRGVIEPSRFVPIAEETGLILPLGRWVLEEACARAAAWAELAPSEAELLTLRLNLSPRQFQQPRMRLVDDVASALAGSGLDAGALSLEITESAVAGDVEGGVAAMRDLKRLGVRLALDDLGTGYSSISSLRRFSFDVAKIDRSFVGELKATGDEEGETVVRALVEVCHALHAVVLAEGVETPEQAQRLRELGCELGQGSCFSEPLPAEELESLIRAGRPLMPVNASGA